MNHSHPREIMPTGDVVNNEGDVLHPDDYTDDESHEERDLEQPARLGEASMHLAELESPSVDLKVYREAELLAREQFAKAQRNRGLEKHLTGSGDTRDLTRLHDKRAEYMRVGTEHFKRAFGYEAMKALAIANGEDIVDFDFHFTLVRNELIRSNEGRLGAAKRDKLRKIIERTK